jgi:hypothetical protein
LILINQFKSAWAASFGLVLTRLLPKVAWKRRRVERIYRMRLFSRAVDAAACGWPGETKELVWQFTKPGSFEFACNIPGHAEAGMAGTITVR